MTLFAAGNHLAVFTVFFVFYLIKIPVSTLPSQSMFFGTKTRYLDSITPHLRHQLTNLTLTISNNRPSQIASSATARVSVNVKDGGGIPVHHKGHKLLADVCQPIHISFLGRHGIRNPGSSDIQTAKNLITRMKPTSLDENILRNLSSIMDGFSVESEKQLTQTGWQELMDIGRAFAYRFADFFHHLQEEDFILQVTSKSRTVDSCKAFISAFNRPMREFDERDDLLRFFDHCEKYVKEVDDNKEALEELMKFRDDHFSDIGHSIAHQLGLKQENFQFTYKEVKAFYVIAASELAVHGTSYLAQFITQDAMKKLEYAADLKNYWKKGYGYPINYQQSCILLKDVINHLQNAADDTTYRKAVLSFAHAETLLPFTSLLGFFKDVSPLRASSIKANRMFKTTKICPFAANIAFVLYSCDVESASSVESLHDDLGHKMDLPSKWDRFMVRVLFNEDNMKLPFTKSDLISLNEFTAHYEPVMSKCNWNNMCSNGRTEL